MAQLFGHARQIPYLLCGGAGPHLSSSGGGPEMLTRLLAVLDQVPRLAGVWRRGQPDAELTTLPGDIIVMSTGTRLHHLVLCVGGNQIVHSWSGKIQLGSEADQRPRLWYALYRPMVNSEQ